MREYVGIACGQCHWFCRLGVTHCDRCGHLLSIDPRFAEDDAAEQIILDVKSNEQVHTRVPVTASQPEEAMEQARSYICKVCSTSVAFGQRFCANCGAEVPDYVREGTTQFFGPMQNRNRARLVLIRGDNGTSGTNYMLQGSSHRLGRENAEISFPSDKTLEATHANFLYVGTSLLVRDEESVNGVYLRVRGEHGVDIGTHVICGEQLFRIDPPPAISTGLKQADETYFYGSPMWESSFRVVQVLAGGAEGMVFCAREERVEIGRTDSDMNFPADIFMSGQHAVVERKPDGRLLLVDRNSKNGTYVRIKQEHPLIHGDYVFIGKQLLRVEMNV